jgi:hypothetical protein
VPLRLSEMIKLRLVPNGSVLGVSYHNAITPFHVLRRRECPGIPVPCFVVPASSPCTSLTSSH